MGEFYDDYENRRLYRDEEFMDRLVKGMNGLGARTQVRKERKKMSSNKMRNAAIILDEELTTIMVSFVPNGDHYTFLCPKYIAKDLVVGSAIVAQKTGNNLVIVYVQEVHEESDINLDDTYKYCFAFQPVDHTYLARLNNDLATSEKMLKTQQRARMREQVRNNLILEHKETTNAV